MQRFLGRGYWALFVAFCMTCTPCTIKASNQNNELINLDDEKVKNSREKSFEGSYTLPTEMWLEVFSYLNQSDIPNVSRTCKQWSAFMNAEILWKRYATRASLVSDNTVLQGKSYKELVKFHSAFSFTALRSVKKSVEKPVEKQDKIDFRPQKISPDGLTVIGELMIGGCSNFSKNPALWTEEKGVEYFEEDSIVSEIGKDFPTPYADYIASKIFYWPEDKGSKPLPVWDNATIEKISGISGDGSVIAGSIQSWYSTEIEALLGSQKDGKAIAVRWWRGKGEEKIEAIEKILKDRKLISPGYCLGEVTAINLIGTAFVGKACECRNSFNKHGAWRAVIPKGNLF